MNYLQNTNAKSLKEKHSLLFLCRLQDWFKVGCACPCRWRVRAPSFSKNPARDNASASSKGSLIFPINDTSDSWRTARACSTLGSRIHTSGETGRVWGESEHKWCFCDCVVHFVGGARFLRTRARVCSSAWGAVCGSERIECLCKTVRFWLHEN